MQPTKNQVQYSLAALETEPRSHESREVVARAIDSLPAGLLEQLERTIDVRPDRLDQARARLEHGIELAADELADRIVGRLVCDRLR
jgi:hypothetical protein